MRFRDFGIGTKLTMTAMASATTAILCVVIAFVVQDLKLVNRIKNEQIVNHSAFVAAHLAVAMGEQREDTVNELLRASSSAHEIIAAAVLSADLQLYASYNMPGLELTAPFTVSSIERYAQQSAPDFPVSVHSTDIVLANGRVANLITLVSRQDVQERIGFMAGYSLMAFLLALGIAFAISCLVQRMVSKPISRLSKLSRKITLTGDYSLRSPVLSRDELGQLAAGFNSMLEQIQLRDNNLEKQVRRRTCELEELAEAFRYRALHDSLTGLPNRALLQEEFYRAVAHANRSGKYFSLMLLDIDNFKQVNDTFGHDFGDELLKEVAQHIQGAVRAEDRVCRLGGDEFVVLMEGISSEATVRAIGENLLRDLYNEIVVKNKKLHVSVSIGASIHPRHGVDLVDLKHKADIAMYHSKDAGKNCLTVFDEAMERRALHRVLVQKDLAHALQNGELEVSYQPQIDVQAKKLFATEALLRWRSEEYGLIKPREFLNFAEHFGLVRDIDYYVVETACKQSAQWLKTVKRCIPVSVNLAGVHFRNTDIVGYISGVLDALALGPQHLIIELTEAVLLEEEILARQVAEEIRALGVRLALDNFGTGNASIHYLRSFPIDIVKLDRSFSRFVDKSEREKKLARGIISLARESDVQLVAEGVETQLQATMLSSMGCHVLQGNWYTEPCPSREFERWMEDNHHLCAA